MVAVFEGVPLVLKISFPWVVNRGDRSSVLLPIANASAIIPPKDVPQITSKYYQSTFGFIPHNWTNCDKKLRER